MDWYSGYVLSFEVSNTLDKDFCIKALQSALSGSKPEIFNSDQGVQFTNDEFINCLRGKSIRISIDGRGRAYDNIFIERLWRTVKYEEVYLNDLVIKHHMRSIMRINKKLNQKTSTCVLYSMLILYTLTLLLFGLDKLEQFNSGTQNVS
jgi:transposase InsO family protein